MATTKERRQQMGLALLAPALIALMLWALYAVNRMDDGD